MRSEGIPGMESRPERREERPLSDEGGESEPPRMCSHVEEYGDVLLLLIILLLVDDVLW